MNKGKTCIWILLWILSSTCVYSQTYNYKDWIIFPQFAIGTSGNINYSSIIQITNSNREERWYGKIYLYGTVVDGKPTRFRADYTVNSDPSYSGYSIINVEVRPLGTGTYIFESVGPLKSGFMELKTVGSGARAFGDDITTSFFFQIHDFWEGGGSKRQRTGELIDSVGVAPGGFGWHFAIPLIVSSVRGIDTGIAYSHFPTTQRMQVVFELRNSAGEQLALKDDIIIYPDNEWVLPYHSAQFVTEIFPDFFADFQHKHRYSPDATFYGSLHIYAQRNINVLALRMDARYGKIQLTSVPSNGELCIDGINRKENCFEEETHFSIGWVPVRKKSGRELELDAIKGCAEGCIPYSWSFTPICIQ